MYHSICLEKIDPTGQLPADIFIKISDRYLKFKGKGEDLSTHKFNKFIQGGMKFIYFRSEELPVVEKWLNKKFEESVNDIVKKCGEQHREKAVKSGKVKESVSDTISSDDPSAENFSDLSKMSSSFVSTVVDDPITGQAINALLDGATGMAAHSINVANLSIYLAMAFGINDKTILNSIYLGAIMHDFGKIKMKSNIFNTFEVNNIPDEHPAKGILVVKESKGLDPIVLDIIEHHHEQFDGGGYPKGLSGSDIRIETQIVAVANYYDQNLKLTEGKKEDIQKLIKEIEASNMTLFAPKLFPKVSRALREAFLK